MLLQHQEAGPQEFISSVPGSILGKASRKSRGKKETFRARFGPLCIPFLSITRLILGHRCSFWMSDATGRCFPLNMLSLSLSLSQSVYSCFPFSLHLQFLLLTARPKGFFPPHTKGHFSITCSLFCKKCTHSSVTLSPVCFLPSLSSRNTVVKVPYRLSPQRYVATERVWFFLGINY